MIRSTPSLALAGVLLAAACASGARPTRDPFAGPSSEARAPGLQVRVINRNFYDARIHAVVGARRIRLGVVSGNSEEVYPLNWQVTDQLSMEIDLVGGARFITPPITASPDERVTLTVESRLENSRLRH